MPLIPTSLDSRWALLPVVMAMALMGATYLVNEWLRDEIAQQATEVDATRERLWGVSELLSQMSRAESSQRGYLITQQPKYLEDYRASRRNIDVVSARLERQYRDIPRRRKELEDLLVLVRAKNQEMQATLQLAQSRQVGEARLMFATGAEQRWVEELRAKADHLAAMERVSMGDGGRQWQRLYQILRYILSVGVLVTLLLILTAVVMIRRDLRQRSTQARELDRLVNERTQELSSLSSHLQTVTERERAALARELHDELGSLLVSIKMDLAQLAKQVDVTGADVAPRWRRILSTINSGVDLKRRIIEQLRPTLLDNMGLIAALKWQVEQRCEAARLNWNIDCPEQELTLNDDCSIALFRVVQEALTNVIKHSNASRVAVTVAVADETLRLIVEDDGTGLAEQLHAGHGVRGMRQRMAALGGQLSISNVSPQGMRLEAVIPLSACAQALDNAALEEA